jgi:hypothetical protein
LRDKRSTGGSVEKQCARATYVHKSALTRSMAEELWRAVPVFDVPGKEAAPGKT